MKTDEDFKEIFGVVSAHKMAFTGKDNLYRINTYDRHIIN